MLGISPDAWREALEAMGERQASAAIAFLLQRCEHSSEAERLSGADGRVMIAVNGSPAIRAPGGYLRALARKASEGGAPLWSAILGHLAQRAKAKGRVGGAGGKAGRAR
jgi:replication initiation protein RepC